MKERSKETGMKGGRQDSQEKSSRMKRPSPNAVSEGGGSPGIFSCKHRGKEDREKVNVVYPKNPRKGNERKKQSIGNLHE